MIGVDELIVLEFAHLDGMIIMYHQQQIKWYPKGVYLPISKLHSILAFANLLAHNYLWWFCYYGQKNSLGLK